MNKLFRSFLGVSVVFGLAGAANALENDGDDVDGNDGVNFTSISWVGKSGNIFHHKVDHANRILSTRRDGSSGPELQFKYDGDSTRPIAARLRGHQWKYRDPTVVGRTTPDGNCSTISPATILTSVATNGYSYGATSKPGFAKMLSTPTVNKKFALRNVVIPKLEIINYDIFWQANYDLQVFVQDYTNQLGTYWDSLLEKDKPRCNWQCDTIYDWAMVGCAAMFEAPPVAAACVLIQTGIKYTCKYFCDK